LTPHSSSSSPPLTTPEAAAAASGVVVRTEPPGWQVWSGLWSVYLIWGSTYLAIRVMVETVPPLLGAGVRFTVAGAVMLAVLAIRRGAAAVAIDRRQLAGVLLIGLLLPGANAVVTVAEQEVPSGLAALLIATVPLWVILLRTLWRDPVPRASLGAVLVGFAGVALLLRPGEQSGEATVLGLAACVGAAAMWASGSFASRKVPLPAHPLVSTGWQMLLGGAACTLAGLVAGEAGDVQPSAFSVRSLVALAYLIVVGSWIAFTAYAWLLQNAPLSKVATYAYVNPVVAILLGWLILDERVTSVTILAASVIVASVALVVRTEASGRRSTPAG
jgi:drug/metabolite transporter (DMT)-like permease